jgi:O-antigen/teichoic acid export membrane protein
MGAAGRHASLRSLFIRGTKYGAALIAPIAIVLMVFAEPIILAWLGKGFAGQGVVAQVLLVPHIVVCLGLMGDAIIISQGKLAKRIPFIFGQAVMNVVISALLIPRVGIIGVAIGTAVSHLLDFPIHLRFLLQQTGVKLADWSREVVLPVYPLLILPGVIAWGLSRTALASSLIGITIACSIALAVYWAALFALALSEPEKQDVARALGAARARFSGGRRGTGSAAD